jgi:hypothetical protein
LAASARITGALLHRWLATAGVITTVHGFSSANTCGYRKISVGLGIYQLMSDNFTAARH